MGVTGRMQKLSISKIQRKEGKNQRAKGIDDHWQVKNLDNKRNEIAPDECQ
jgi:hypothetical protein